MELDELRRQWLQPEPAPPPLSPAELNGLLHQRSDGLVDRMRRNARLETAFSALVAAAMPVAFFLTSNVLYRVQAVAMFLLALVMLGYYFRKLAMLQRMTRPDVDVRDNLRQLCAGLRSMLEFMYRLTLASGPLSLLLMYGFVVGRELARPAGPRSGLLLGLAGALLFFGVLLQWFAIKATRWYLQRLYGQHLDRLEGLLQELEE